MTLPWIKRSDLTAIPHDAGGWIVKDPLTLQYAHLEDTEYQILNLIDGRRNVAKLLADIRRLLPTAGLTPHDIAGFLQTLANYQLIRQTNGQDTIRFSKTTSTPWLMKALSAALSVLRLKVKLINPTRLIDAAMPMVAPLFHPTAVRLFATLSAVAVAMTVLRFGKLTRQLPTMQQFLGPQNLIVLVVIYVVVKLLHEAGHAFTARHFGAECNESGVMLMMLTPVLYTNVTDGWLLPKQQRMLITASGILVELTIAAACTLLWWYAEPGGTRSVLLNTMLICSVNTLLFNGNPLLRFDGYFLLADWVGIPNLATRASAVMRSSLLAILTGRDPSIETSMGRRRFLLGYGILSALYRLGLTLAILRLILQVTDEWHLTFLGTALTFIILAAFVGIPLFSFAMQLRHSIREAVENEGTSAATGIRVALCGGIVLIGLLVPLPRTVVAPAVVQPNMAAIYTTLPGKRISARMYGADVHSDQTIVELRNEELHRTGNEFAAEAADLQIQLEALLSSPDTATSELLPQIREALTVAQQREARFAAETMQLQIKAPTSGVLFPPPFEPQQRSDDLPQQWFGTPLDPSNSGAWLQRGTLLGHVGRPDEVHLIVAVGEDDVQLLQPGQSFQFLSTGAAVGSKNGLLKTVSRLEEDQWAEQLGIAGLVNGRIERESLRPANVTFPVLAILSEQSAGSPPALYSTGRVRIKVASASILQRVLRYLRQAF